MQLPEPIARFFRGALVLAAITAAVVVVLVVVALVRGHGANRDQQVASDLSSLVLSRLQTTPDSVTCSHQTGDEYSCVVTLPDRQQQFVQVTDDGHSIVEQGIAAP